MALYSAAVCWPCLAAAMGLFLLGRAGADEIRSAGETFMVMDRGTTLLGADGEEIERLGSKVHGVGAFSPDGRWVVLSQLEQKSDGKRYLVIESRGDSHDRTTVPLAGGTTGPGFSALWSSDSKRIL